MFPDDDQGDASAELPMRWARAVAQAGVFLRSVCGPDTDLGHEVVAWLNAAEAVLGGQWRDAFKMQALTHDALFHIDCELGTWVGDTDGRIATAWIRSEMASALADRWAEDAARQWLFTDECDPAGDAVAVAQARSLLRRQCCREFEGAVDLLFDRLTETLPTELVPDAIRRLWDAAGRAADAAEFDPALAALLTDAAAAIREISPGDWLSPSGEAEFASGLLDATASLRSWRQMTG